MSSPEPTRPINQTKSGPDTRAWLQSLPDYSRSLLKIQLPVAVTLATTRRSIRSILELVPGSILQFEKNCDEPLSLEVGNLRVAEGETVKVGDKFGLRLTSIVLPAERFGPVRGKRAGRGSQPPASTDA